MTAPRLTEVVARVVAWHNRHPLARRIDASQVHSIGEVRLPFASTQAWADTPAATPAATAPAATATSPETAPAPSPTAAPADAGHAPTLAEALAQRHARQAAAPEAAAPAIDGLDVASVLPDPEPPFAPPATDTTDTAAPTGAGHDDTDDGEAALVIPLLDGDDGAAEPAARAAPADDLPPEPAPTAPDAPDAPAAAPPAPEPDIALDFGDAAPPDAADPAVADPAVSEPAPAAADAGAASGTDDTQVYPPPHGNVPASALARAVERRAAARAGAVVADPVAEQATEPAAAPAGEPPVDLPAADLPAPARSAPPAFAAPAPAGGLRRLVDALRRLVGRRQAGLPPLRAAFSADFAWPLRPAAIARWAQRHGRPEPLAPLEWPRRSIDIDRARLSRHRAQGFSHDLPLHVLTAAIGVGDRRIRVLVGADGAILGPRAFDRGRSSAAAVLLGAGLVALGWNLRPLQAPPADPAALLAAAAQAGASAPAPALAASAASAADAAPSVPLEAASAASAAAQALAAASDAAAPAPAASAVDPVQAAATASAPAAAASEPAGDIRPLLSDAEKYAARVEAAQLRGEPPPPAPEPAGPVYAVVGPASRSPEVASRSLAQMRAAAARLDGGAPAHGELVNSQGQWRAAWWPFTSLVDAERARVLLAGRGVKAEVIEF